MASPNRGSVKVVLIDTRYVKVDPTSFKSVVQSLTGKDSGVAWVENSSLNGSKKRSASSITHESKRGLRPDHALSSTNNYNHVNIGGNDSSFMLTSGMSFKDLDRMLLEMPPLEDLEHFLSDQL